LFILAKVTRRIARERESVLPVGDQRGEAPGLARAAQDVVAPEAGADIRRCSDAPMI